MSLIPPSIPNSMKHLVWATEWSSRRVFIGHKNMLHVCIIFWKVIVVFRIPLYAHKNVFLEKCYWGKNGLVYNIHIFKPCLLFSLIFVFFSPTIYNSVIKKKQTTKPPQNPNPCLFFNRNSKNLTLTFTYFFQPIVFMENKTHFLCKFKICLFACLFSLSRASCILIYHCRVTWMSSCFLFFPFKEMMERQHIRYCEKGTH